MIAGKELVFVKTFLSKHGADFLFKIPLTDSVFTTVSVRSRKQRPHQVSMNCKFNVDNFFDRDGKLETTAGVDVGLNLNELVRLLLSELKTINGIERFPSKVIVEGVKRFEGAVERTNEKPLGLIFEELANPVNGYSKYVISYKGFGKEREYVFGWSPDPDGKRTHRIILFRAPGGFKALGGGFIEIEDGKLSLIGGSDYNYPPFSILHQVARELTAFSEIEITRICIEGRVRYRFDL